ncbi:MAG: S8 family serine peptidase [Egibacteraceae bacterium]
MTCGARGRGLRLLAALAALSLWAALAPAATADPAGAGPGAPPERPDGSWDGAAFAPDEVIVRWRAGASASARSGARAQHGLVATGSAPRTGVEFHRITNGRAPDAVARGLQRDGRVEHAEPNSVLRALADPPNDPAFGSQWGLHNTGQTIEANPGVAGVDVDVLDAWDDSLGADVVVAVIDEGTDREHPDLNANMWVNPDPGTDLRYPDDDFGWDFHHDDNSVFDPADGDSHGTHVSGTVAAVTDNGLGVAGVAPDATVMPLKFLGPDGGLLEDAILAIDYAAERGVRIANNSWGSDGFSEFLGDAIEGSGIAFIAAAGNEGRDVDAAPTYPCSYDLPNVLCVAAVDNNGDLAGYSNFGAASVHVGAPGTAVASTFPRLPDMTMALQIDAPAYDAMFWGFDLSDVSGGAAPRTDALDRALDHLGAAADDPILLVDDDESALGFPDARPLYLDALGAGGYTDVTVHDVVADTAGPTAAQMDGHTVVWFTGAAFGDPPDGATTLTDADQANLTTFLDAGGALLLAGADAIYRIEGSAFVSDRLHAEFLGETTGRAGLQGQAGTVYDGAVYDLVANLFVDNIAPASAAATPALTFPGETTYADAYAFLAGTSMATPHASGVAALVASLRPALSGTEIVDLLKDTAVPLAALDGVTTTGGLVSASAAVQATLALPELAVPGAPAGVSAVAGDGAATVSWSAPGADGGSAVTGYTVTAEPRGASVTVGGDAREATVAGLDNGTAYTFTVHATNAVGDGPASAASAPVTPLSPEACPEGGVPDAGFGDVAAGNVHAAAVSCAAWYGLAQGTGATTFAPGTSVRRDQMASFIGRLVEQAGVELDASGAPFGDVAGNVHAPRINGLANAGIVQGVRPGEYAPSALVTRDQMASFLVRTYELLVEQTLPAPPHGFTDVAGTVHEAAIAKSAGAGFARGLSATTYGPRQQVRRDQMASFLTRVLQQLVHDGLVQSRA